MKNTNKIAAIAMLISVLNSSQSYANPAGETTRKYYMGGDKIKYECIFDNNKKEDGVCKKFYKNGHLEKETRCTNNGKNTAYKTFFENGELASEGRYTNGQRNGLFKQYYWRSASALSFRQTSSESSYKDGYRHGFSKEYSPNGTVTWSQNYN